MPRKGFYTDSSYHGFVFGIYMKFPTEGEYIEFIEDLESELNPEVTK